MGIGVVLKNPYLKSGKRGFKKSVEKSWKSFKKNVGARKMMRKK